jgi:hypothetical protein
MLTPSWHASVDVVSSDICDEDREKCDYTRSISKKTRQDLDWFMLSRRVIAIRPVLLYYAVEEFVTTNKLRGTTYID